MKNRYLIYLIANVLVIAQMVSVCPFAKAHESFHALRAQSTATSPDRGDSMFSAPPNKISDEPSKYQEIAKLAYYVIKIKRGFKSLSFICADIDRIAAKIADEIDRHPEGAEGIFRESCSLAEMTKKAIDQISNDIDIFCNMPLSHGDLLVNERINFMSAVSLQASRFITHNLPKFFDHKFYMKIIFYKNLESNISEGDFLDLINMWEAITTKLLLLSDDSEYLYKKSQEPSGVVLRPSEKDRSGVINVELNGLRIMEDSVIQFSRNMASVDFAHFKRSDRLMPVIFNEIVSSPGKPNQNGELLFHLFSKLSATRKYLDFLENILTIFTDYHRGENELINKQKRSLVAGFDNERVVLINSITVGLFSDMLTARNSRPDSECPSEKDMEYEQACVETIKRYMLLEYHLGRLANSWDTDVAGGASVKTENIADDFSDAVDSELTEFVAFYDYLISTKAIITESNELVSDELEGSKFELDFNQIADNEAEKLEKIRQMVNLYACVATKAIGVALGIVPLFRFEKALIITSVCSDLLESYVEYSRSLDFMISLVNVNDEDMRTEQIKNLSKYALGVKQWLSKLTYEVEALRERWEPFLGQDVTLAGDLSSADCKSSSSGVVEKSVFCATKIALPHSTQAAFILSAA